MWHAHVRPTRAGYLSDEPMLGVVARDFNLARYVWLNKLLDLLQVLYLGAAAGTTVSHVADIVGPSGCVYAVEFAHRPGRDLINMAKSRTNVIPIIEDARHPLKYRMLVGMVDTVFADVAQPDQVRYQF